MLGTICERCGEPTNNYTPLCLDYTFKVRGWWNPSERNKYQ